MPECRACPLVIIIHWHDLHLADYSQSSTALYPATLTPTPTLTPPLHANTPHPPCQAYGLCSYLNTALIWSPEGGPPRGPEARAPSSLATILGLSLGAAALVALVIVAAFVVMRRWKRRRLRDALAAAAAAQEAAMKVHDESASLATATDSKPSGSGFVASKGSRSSGTRSGVEANSRSGGEEPAGVSSKGPPIVPLPLGWGVGDVQKGVTGVTGGTGGGTGGTGGTDGAVAGTDSRTGASASAGNTNGMGTEGEGFTRQWGGRGRLEAVLACCSGGLESCSRDNGVCRVDCPALDPTLCVGGVLRLRWRVVYLFLQGPADQGAQGSAHCEQKHASHMAPPCAPGPSPPLT